jgi:hypothetical protein
MAKKKRSRKAESAETAPAPKRAKTQKDMAKRRAKLPKADVEETLDGMPDNVLLRIFIKAGYKGRLAAMQGVLQHLSAVTPLHDAG